MIDPPAPAVRPRRILSLLASATEIVWALRLADRLVGRSHESDDPPSVTRVPAHTDPQIAPDGRDIEIDQRVTAIANDPLDISNCGRSDRCRSLDGVRTG